VSLFTIALVAAHHAWTLGPCRSLPPICHITDHRYPPLPSRLAEIGPGFWKSYVIGDFLESDARKYFGETLIRAGSSATVDDSVWAKVYEVRHSARSEAELCDGFGVGCCKSHFCLSGSMTKLCCDRFVAAMLEPSAAWQRRWPGSFTWTAGTKVGGWPGNGEETG
jgi:hypothetical protein